MASNRSTISHVLDLHTQVRRDGRVLLFTMGTGFHIGAVEQRDTHDGKSWFWSRDGFEDECLGGARTRREALLDMLETMHKEGSK